MDRESVTTRPKMDQSVQSVPNSKEMNESDNDSFDRKGQADGETTASSDMSSFYEINVHENLSSESSSNKGSSYFYVRPKLMVKVKKVGGNKESKENNQNIQSFVENIKKIANPLIESYYPFLEDHQIGIITIEVNVNPFNLNDNEGGKRQENMSNSVDEKSSENSESSSWSKSSENAARYKQAMKKDKKLAINNVNNIRKFIKRQIIHDILTRKDSEFKGLEWNDVDDQLHIHHHEHHHHYYVDAAKFKVESDFSLLQNGSNSTVHWSEDKENGIKRLDAKEGDLLDFDVKEKERSNYVYDCSRQHPVNFLTNKNNSNLTNLSCVERSKEYIKIPEKYSSQSGSLNPVKKASSVDSVSDKKSDLLVFHNYSHKEVSKCESEESSFIDVRSSRSTMNLSRNGKRGSKTENKWSKVLLLGEREVVAENVIHENDSTYSGTPVLKNFSKEECDKKRKNSIEMLGINKIPGNLSDLVDTFKQSLEKNKVGMDEPEKQSHENFTTPVKITSSENEPVDVKTDKETCDEVKSIKRTSLKDTANAVKTAEERSHSSHEKFNRSKTPKYAGNSKEKMRSYSRKRTDSKEQVPLKPKQTFGLSGNNYSKGVVHCYYSCSRNQECNKTLNIEKNRKRST